MREYIFLEFERIVTLNKLAVETFGGAYFVRDMVVIESAVNQPRATFAGTYLHEGIFHMAAAYYYHLSECQGFADGNKRTGFLAMFSFLRLNGCNLIIPDVYLWPILMDVAKGLKDKSDLAEFLTENVICKEQ